MNLKFKVLNGGKLADIDDAVAVDSLEDSERGAGGFGSTGA